MAIYRGKGGATNVEPAPGDTEFAGSLIVEGDILDKGNLLVEKDILAYGTITAEGGFTGDGSELANLPNVWSQDDGNITQFEGNGSTTTQVWAENNGHQAKVIQRDNGATYFKGERDTYIATGGDFPVNIQVGGINQLAIGKDSVYSFQPVTAPSFIGDGSQLTGLPPSGVPEAPENGETYARNNATWVSISDSAGIPEAPDDGLQYGRQNEEWTEVVTGGDTYTKAEIDAQQNAQDTKITVNNDEIARQQIEITNNTAGIVKNDGDINTNITNIATNTGNIASNTTAIGTLSGQVADNSADIAELQDSIFFSSAYSADYPSTPNRDPEEGNMYLQNFAMFTYSYAEATQIFCSKTDESGNVRQFTAIQAGDSIVLNEVDSPNYGRYELVTVEDVSDSYVVMNVIPKKGQGTVITGVKVAFQAFPKPDSGGGDAQPPVAFNLQLTSSVTTKQGLNTPIVLDKAVVDTENGLKDGGYEVQKDGLYDISFIAKASSSDGNLNNFYGYVYLNGTFVMQSSADPYRGGATPTGAKGFSVSGSSVLDLRKGDEITLQLYATTSDSADITVPSNALSLSGHMISSFTEGSGGGIWTEVGGVATYDGSVAIGATDANQKLHVEETQEGVPVAIQLRATTTGAGGKSWFLKGNPDTRILSLGDGGINDLTIDQNGKVETPQDMTVNSVPIGSGNSGGGGANIAIGGDALHAQTSGTYNVAVGWKTLAENIDANYNTAIGGFALNKTKSVNNTALGYRAGDSLETGSSNTLLGYQSGQNLISGNNNICVGYQAKPSQPDVSNEVTIGNDNVTVTRLKGEVQTTQDMTVNGVTVGQGNGTGINNLSVGLESLGKNTEGTQNTSVGAYAMHENTSGNGNTVLGNSAFYRNTEGSDNTAIGNNALPFNTTGTLNTAVGANTLKANVSGGDNTALGNNALSVNEGSRNTALGNNALTNVTDANNSVAVGCSALGSFETGVDNIAIGKSSASTLTSGNNNIVIGTSAQPSLQLLYLTRLLLVMMM